MAPRKRRVFTAEFKADAVRLCRAGDRSIGQVAKRYGPGRDGVTCLARSRRK
jgi:transposase